MSVNFDVIPYLEDLWRYARVLTRDDSDADDLVQEALVRALSLAKSYDTSRPLLPWLIAIVRNTFLSGASRMAADRQRLASYADLSDRTSPPAQEHCAELADVGRALSGMPAEQAEILHVVGVLGFTYSEAADLLGVPAGTVMSRLSRARVALKQSVENATGQASGSLKIVGGRDVAE
ncbi:MULTISPECIES: sigma-70 family RNA polymerase sigma factor [unclassified Mesorhizobium]|uniref:sigma-70 family RNA polymerase sigma factor n=1 Tax=unclassified Mesorhizobium TaxID=325217 RepID=UPI00112AFBCB|nr:MULTISPECIES: sigma-70 family RNA polymerase sigma factor [unclassified Mesorhizobium]TPI57428.1 sigma-70 family RNA polymerase sigma factor [Mesorhizobium sp. B3-1-7]TPJ37114.1 sigma-70 family RNA polymerase sigma factor [Mesorhizobium sp. B2-8-3]